MLAERRALRGLVLWAAAKLHEGRPNGTRRTGHGLELHPWCSQVLREGDRPIALTAALVVKSEGKDEALPPALP